MTPLNAFLAASALSYFVAAVMPLQLIKEMPRVYEKLEMLVSGLTLAAALYLDLCLLWLLVAVVWTVFAGLSFTGYVQWNMQWKEEPSDAAQMSMFAWNLLIAICALMNLGVWVLG